MNLEGPIDCPLCGEWFSHNQDATTKESARAAWQLCFHLGFWHDLRIVTGSITWSNICACGEEFETIEQMIQHLDRQGRALDPVPFGVDCGHLILYFYLGGG